MTRDEAIQHAVFNASGRRLHPRIRLRGDESSSILRDLRRFGFAIVPLEPTKRMLSASGGLWGDADANIYRAMTAAYEKEQGDDQSQV